MISVFERIRKYVTGNNSSATKGKTGATGEGNPPYYQRKAKAKRKARKAARMARRENR